MTSHTPVTASISPLFPNYVEGYGQQPDAQADDDEEKVQAGGEIIEIEEDEDAQPMRTAPTPAMPTQADLDKHRDGGHIPYRSWCGKCVEGFGRE